jgi:hypothetical protein
LLAAPDQRTWFGRRDHAFLLVAAQTGLRQSLTTGEPQERRNAGKDQQRRESTQSRSADSYLSSFHHRVNAGVYASALPHNKPAKIFRIK